MASGGTVTIGQKYGLPPFKEDCDLDNWIYELELWKLVTDLPQAKMGPVVYLSLSEKVRHSCSSVKKEDLSKDDGLDTLITKLREVYMSSAEQQCYSAYERFETYSRPESMSIQEYINQFEQLNQKLINTKIELPPAVLAYQLLKNANLSTEKKNLVRATIPEITYEAMKKQIKAIHDHCVTSSSKDSDDTKILVDQDSVLYTSKIYRGGGRGHKGSFASRGRGNVRGSYRAMNFSKGNISQSGQQTQPSDSTNWRQSNQVDSSKGANVKDSNGDYTRCHVCQSIFHYAAQCPDKNKRQNVQFLTESKDDQTVFVQLFTEDVSQCYLEKVVSETLSCALVDCGATATVCGKNWLECYKDSIETPVIDMGESNKSFKFGDGMSYKSLAKVNIPVNIGGVKDHILSDVVECEIPLLLSKPSMKAANCTLDFAKDKMTMNGREIHLQQTSNGHYCIPLTPKQSVHVDNPTNTKIALTIVDSEMKSKSNSDIENMALKLHKQFGHPVDSNKLKRLLKEAGISDTRVNNSIEKVTEECDTCNRYRKAKSRPIVSFALSQSVNDCLAMDLKFIKLKNTTHIIHHMIDTFSRFSMASVIPSKRKEIIANSVLRNWVSIFGTPGSILSDNGGEFDNELLRDVCELLDTKVMTSAAYAPWSNGIVERHNAVIENMVLKIMDDINCSIETALVWAVSAKNALSNNKGFSPNQLVFGKNPNLPSVLTLKPPALRNSTSSELVADHLNALNAARKAFIESESSSKIKTALSHQTRNASGKEFFIGDRVYYKRNDDKEWHGPGVIMGIDGKQIFVRHGGYSIKVSPCHLYPAKSKDKITSANKFQNIETNTETKMDSDTFIMIENKPFHESKPKSQPQTQNNDVMAEIQHEQEIQPAQIVTETHTPRRDVQHNALLQSLHSENSPSSPQNRRENALISSVKKHIVERSQEANRVIILLPKPNERVKILNKDTNTNESYVVISRAGKSGGAHENWFNVKNLTTNQVYSINFAEVCWSIIQEEVLYSQENDPEILQAKLTELEKWKQFNTYTEVSDHGNDAITTRWVVTEKTIDGIKGYKARLVARGFEENTENVKSDSPTISKENLRLICNLAVTNNWVIHSIDVTSAFLQGLPIERDIYILPPPEANTSNLWKLNVPVYGLADASRSWYMKVAKELIDTGAKKSIYDNALYFWKDSENKLSGFMGSHVDDLLHGGNEQFRNTIIQTLKNRFAMSAEHEQNFRYLGVEMDQQPGEISMNQHHYIESLNKIQLVENTPGRKLSRGERRLLKGLIGQLQWVAKQTRPDIAFMTCQLSTRINKATVKDVKDANKQVIKLKQEKLTVSIPDTGEYTTTKFVVFSDASHANLPDNGSQGGFVIFLQGSNGKACPLLWVSRKLKRTVKSAMAAETMAFLEAAEHAMLLRQLLSEILDIESANIPIVCCIDSKQVHDAVNSTKTCEDKRNQIDISALREMIENKEIEATRKVSSENNLADCLTKETAPADKLMRVISGATTLNIE